MAILGVLTLWMAPYCTHFSCFLIILLSILGPLEWATRSHSAWHLWKFFLRRRRWCCPPPPLSPWCNAAVAALLRSGFASAAAAATDDIIFFVNGMKEKQKKKKVTLRAHPIIYTYFNIQILATFKFRVIICKGEYSHMTLWASGFPVGLLNRILHISSQVARGNALNKCWSRGLQTKTRWLFNKK